MTRRIAITGGSGFIGVNLVEFYRAQGDEVLNLDVQTPRNPALAPWWRRCDLNDAAALSTALEQFKPDWVLHVGARTDLDGATIADYAANTDGVSNLIAAIQRCGSVRRVMFFSSKLVCRNGHVPANPHDYCPEDAYGASKVAGERRVSAAAARLPEWLIVRPTSIWGPWFDIPYKTFFNVVRRGLYLHPRGRRIPKNFGYVGNIVHKIDRLMSAPAAQVQGRMLYLCDSPPLVMPDFAYSVRAAFDAPPVRQLPILLLQTAALCGDLLKKLGWRQPPLTSFRLNNILTPIEFDTRELDAICGASPYSIEDGVKITVDWMRAQDASR